MNPRRGESGARGRGIRVGCVRAFRLVACLALTAALVAPGSPTLGAAALQVVSLAPGQQIERDLAGGERHEYAVAVDGGQYVDLVVDQNGVDAVVAVYGPGGTLVGEFDGADGSQDPENVLFVSTASGAHRIEVRAFEPNAARGTYRIALRAVRTATDADRQADARRIARAGALALTTETTQLWLKGGQVKSRTVVEHLDRALELARSSGDEVVEAIVLSSYGYVHYWAADWAKAETFFLRAVGLFEKHRGKDALELYLPLNGLGMVYDWGKLDAKGADAYYRRAIALLERSPDMAGADLPSVVNNYGQFLLRGGEPERAEPVLRRALTLLKPGTPNEAGQRIIILMGLGHVAATRKAFDEAEASYRQALDLAGLPRSPVSQDFPKTALASLALARNQVDRAGALADEILGAEKQSIEKGGVPNLHAAAVRLQVFLLKGDIARAVEFESRLEEIFEQILARNLGASASEDQAVYAAKFVTLANGPISIHVDTAPNDPAARRLALTTILRRKGRALDAMAASVSALRRRLGDEDVRLLGELATARSRLAALAFSPGDADEARDVEAGRLRGQIAELETRVSLRGSEARAVSRPITLEAIQAKIPRDAALVELFAYRPPQPAQAERTANVFDFLGPPRYVAYVLRAEGEPAWVDLGGAAAIDRLVAAFRASLRSPKRGDVRRHARALDRAVMQPVRGLLGDARRLLVSPDGSLTLVPFAALVDERDRYLVSRYEIDYLTSGRDLLSADARVASRQGPLVVANPDYGRPGPASSGRDITHGPAPGSSGSIFFGELPGTKDEARILGTMLPGATVLVRAEASEQAVKRATGPRILHVATHGFFLDAVRPVGGGERGLELGAAGPPRPAVETNPLLRAGVALAGANLGAADGEDGILTALEVAGLDLWGTQLVVLSACDTGVGEVRTGEGVYGLRRALVLAGSETQVMSLWPVSDAGTRDLMEGYYRRLLAGEGRGEALRRVQLAMLESPTRRHPFYWASFIVSGQWARLDASPMATVVGR